MTSHHLAASVHVEINLVLFPPLLLYFRILFQIIYSFSSVLHLLILLVSFISFFLILFNLSIKQHFCFRHLLISASTTLRTFCHLYSITFSSFLKLSLYGHAFASADDDFFIIFSSKRSYVLFLLYGSFFTKFILIKIYYQFFAVFFVMSFNT